MDGKLEVIELTKRYGCPICKSVYDWQEDAEKCLAKGIIGEGPAIKPGLVLKNLYYGAPDSFAVFIGESINKEHMRKDKLFRFDKIFKRKHFFKKERVLDYIDFTARGDHADLYRDVVNRYKSRVQFLDESEFEEFKRFIDDYKNIRLFDDNERVLLSNLYKYHPYFDDKLN